MPTFSLRSLLSSVGLFAILLAICVTPRGSISPTSASKIYDGISEEEAIAIVGLRPGWYDGIGMLAGFHGSSKSDRKLEWVNLGGAILVDANGELKNARFVSRKEFRARADIQAILHDRMIQRFLDFTSPASTILILSMLVIFALLPSILFCQLFRLPSLDCLLYGTTAALIALGILSACLGQTWIGHHDENFPIIALLIPLVTTTSSCTHMIRRVFASRRKVKTALLEGES